MKIEYILLRNFSNINTAFKSKEISIDFSKSKNKIILFTGPNGSGKTSILSCLHPFATNGNLDIRNDNPLILVGKDGYKEIILTDGEDRYVIKHFYTPSKESHSVKSYIVKNGLELNPNGNVTSFKDIIRDELDIEMDYLKLTRLGSNVTNFIDLKTTDRKSFMGKILDEVDIYLKYYKKITTDMREVKSIISHTVDKISKLNITDIEELKKYQKELNKSITKYKTQINILNSRISVLDYEINKYDSPLILKESIDVKKKELDKIYRLLNKKDSQSITKDNCVKEISDLEKTIIYLESDIEKLLNERESILNIIDKNIEELDTIKLEIQKIEDSSDLKDSEHAIKEIHDRIESRSKEYKVTIMNPSYTREELEGLLLTLEKCMEILFSTYEFGQEPIKKAIEFIQTREDVANYVATNNEKLTRNKLQSLSEYVYNALTKKHGMVRPNCKESSSCQVMNFYNELYDLATEVPDTVVEDEAFVMYTKMAYQNINTVLKYIKDSKDIFEKMPDRIKEMFRINDIFQKIMDLKYIFDKSIFYEEMTFITEYELQQEDLQKLKEEKEKLQLIKKSIGNSEYFVKKEKDLLEENEELKDKLSDILQGIEDKTKQLSYKKSLLEEFIDLSECIEKKDDVEKEYSDLSDTFSKVKSICEEKKGLSEELSTYEFSYEKRLKEYNENSYKITSYTELNDELSMYNDKYDEMTLIKNSLSAKEGIPLLYIQIYLKNIQEIANDLLDIIYDGNLYIDNFNITADEFKIPYVTKGTTIKDVSYASQGEKSFISLALSFALIYQSISQYNVMLLDEIDATLDTRNREKFLQILEKQLEMIYGEQIFVISHNNMFNMYPVDVIDMRNKKDDNNKLANYIKIHIK